MRVRHVRTGSEGDVVGLPIRTTGGKYKTLVIFDDDVKPRAFWPSELVELDPGAELAKEQEAQYQQTFVKRYAR